MAVPDLVRFWQNDPEISRNVTAWCAIPEKSADFEDFPPELNPVLVNALTRTEVHHLYSHQALSFRLAKLGKNQVIVTGTASGKTLCYNLPILDDLIENPNQRALYLFPTKALAQDQENFLRGLLVHLRKKADLPIGVYDGDTAAGMRPRIREEARIILSNPDMLHVSILPHHIKWANFFSNLAHIVIDETHAYRGVFGSHVANVIRRLKRITKFYGASPKFFLTSATIANPDDHASRLIEEPVSLVDQDGAAKGRKHFLIYNPPIVDPELGIRKSAMSESIRLTEDLLAYKIQGLVFGGTRRSVELTLSYLQREATAGDHPVRGYRSGYLPRHRREIEEELRTGEVGIVVATNALELGIDIGGMGAVVMAGYPGTISGTWQQAGRAGRGKTDSLAVLIAGSNPLDQFLAHHPDYFFERSPEMALIDPDNILLLYDHLRCAAFELPFDESESFGNLAPTDILPYLEVIQANQEVHHTNKKFFWISDAYPAYQISLRNASAKRILLEEINQEEVRTIGQVDYESAHWMVHPGAIYLHEALTYRVKELDLEYGSALVESITTDYYTQPSNETTVQLLNIRNEMSTPTAFHAHGDVSVTSQVVGYHKIHWETRERLDTLDLDMPPVTLETTAYWLAIKEDIVEKLREAGLWRDDPNRYGRNWQQQRDLARARDGFLCQVCGRPEAGTSHHVHHKVPFRSFATALDANQLENLITLCPSCHRRAESVVRIRSGLSGLAYTFSHLAPLFLMCDIRDLGVHVDPQSPLAGGQPTVVLFDRVPAGIGFSQRLYEIHLELIQSAHALVTECSCENGCPSCVGPAGEAGIGGKRETLALLSGLLNKRSFTS